MEEAEPGLVAAVEEMAREAVGGLEASLERVVEARADEAFAARVEEDPGHALAFLLVLVDEELRLAEGEATRAGLPVDAARRVAPLVLADVLELGRLDARGGKVEFGDGALAAQSSRAHATESGPAGL